jgi:hypothetical protein
MDGSGSALIAIPVVVTISLVVWLVAVYYAASHPRWRHGPAARSAAAGAGASPALPHSELLSLPAAGVRADRPAEAGRPPAAHPAGTASGRPHAA